MKENIYLVYSETKQGDFWNGQAIQCDNIEELIYQLRQAIAEKKRNIQIHTITNGKPQ